MIEIEIGIEVGKKSKIKIEIKIVKEEKIGRIGVKVGRSVRR